MELNYILLTMCGDIFAQDSELKCQKKNQNISVVKL